MTLKVEQIYPIFHDIDGQPVDDGYIYIGTYGLNPEASPITAYWDEDLTIPAAQPIRTINGYPSRSGTAATLFIDGVQYSITVRNKNGSLIHSELMKKDKVNGVQVVDSKAAAVVIQPTTTRNLYVRGDDGGLFYGVTAAAPGTYSDNGGSYCGTVFIPTGGDGSSAWVREYDGDVSVKWFGAKGDGVTNDTTAIQAALDYVGASPLALEPVISPAGEYLVDTLYLPLGVNFKGAGFLENLDIAATLFIQNSAVDIIRFKPRFGGFYYYWHGQISNMSFIGNSAFGAGSAISAKDSSGNTIIFTDQTVIEKFTTRFMPEHGLHMTSGALPIKIGPCKHLWNQGAGIRCDRIAQFQGVHFADVSGDGNIGGLIYLKDMSINDNFLMTSLKSEKRVNNEYGGVAAQANAIIAYNCSDCGIHIAGANHISSVPDGGNFEKPGDFISVTGGGTYPRISWDAVVIRVRAGDTGTDPKIVGGMSAVHIPDYTEMFGIFNTDYTFFKGRMILHRDTVSGDTTPSAAERNIMLFNDSSPLTVTNFDDPVDGQLLIVIGNTSNTTIQSNANILLKTGANVTLSSSMTITFAYVGGKWRELSRSYNSAPPTYTITNALTDRTYNANATSVEELADVLATLISDLQARGVM